MRKIFGVYDRKIGSYVDFIVSVHDVEVVRQMTVLVRGGRTAQSLFPNDFKIDIIGEIDDITGEVINCDSLLVAECIDLLEKVGDDNEVQNSI